MYTMKEVCNQTGVSYETLKFYCNKGLIPNIKRNKNNYRIFDEDNIAWIHGLLTLKKCGMSMDEMKHYLDLCLIGFDSISERKAMLDLKAEALLKKSKEIDDCICFITQKQVYYTAAMKGEVPYVSNLKKEVIGSQKKERGSL